MEGGRRARVPGARLAAALGGLFVACGSSATPPPPDAAAGDAGAAAPAAAALPTPVSMVCPAGWTSVERDGDVTCDPWPSGSVACGDAEAPFPGEPGCAPIGAPCPADGWPEGLPIGASAIWVRAGSVAGDGTRASPFATIAEAAAAASAGSILALAPGTYQVTGLLPSGVTIWGACPISTTLVGAPSSAATLRVPAGELTVRAVTVEGPGEGVLVTGGRVTLEDVRVLRAALVGVRASGGELVATGLVVRDTTADATGNFGHGLVAEAAGHIEVERASIERHPGGGLAAFGAGSSIVARGVALVDDRIAVYADDGATVSLEAGAVSRSGVPAIAVYGAGTTATLTLSVVRDTQAGDVGGGMEIATGAAGRLASVSFLDSPEVGVIVAEPSSMLEASDLVVVRTHRVPSSGGPGAGIVLQDGARARLERVSIAESEGTSLLVTSAATLSATDVAVRRSAYARGIGVEDGATVEATRVLVEDVRYAGFVALGEGASVAADDVTVRGVDAAPSDATGIGRGIYAVSGATMRLRRVRVEDAREIGVGAAWDSSVSLEDAVVVHTRERGCATTGACPGAGSGAGVAGLERGSIDLRRFVVMQSALVGVQILDGTSVDLHDGEVRDNPTGANVQAAGYDLARLMDGVRYVDNGVALDTSVLPIPEATLP